MDLTKLECFLSVVQNQNYSLAAEQISLSQSSVSKHILQMEKELGVKLLERNANHSRKVELTEAGREVCADFEKIWDIWREIQYKLERYQEKPVLRIGSVDHLQEVGAMTPIVAFMREHPEIQVVFEETDTLTLLERLKKREIDTAVIAHIYSPFSKAGNLSDFPLECYRYHTVVRDYYYLAVSRSHRLAGYKNIDWKDLDSESLILLDKSFSSNRIIRDALKHYGCRANIAFETNGVDSIWGLIQENYGVALLSRKVIQHLKGVVAVSMKEPIHRDTTLLTAKESDKASRCFWDFFVSYQK